MDQSAAKGLCVVDRSSRMKSFFWPMPIVDVGFTHLPTKIGWLVVSFSKEGDTRGHDAFYICAEALQSKEFIADLCFDFFQPALQYARIQLVTRYSFASRAINRQNRSLLWCQTEKLAKTLPFR